MEVLRFLPKNILSHLVGRASYIRLPSSINTRLLRYFCTAYGVSLEEAEHPLEFYPSLGDFFLRNLKTGLREIGEGVVSPVDGTMSQCAAVNGTSVLQVKGREYSLRDLLLDEKLAESFHGGHYITIYLAPGDYHHIHSPVRGALREILHVSGTLWPVNEWSLKRIDKLFCRNERVISVLESDEVGKIVLVKVGATNVGSIRHKYAPVQGNKPLRIFPKSEIVERVHFDSAPRIEKGERIASFYLGSTVILLFQKDSFQPDTMSSSKLHMGQTIGRGKLQ